VPPEQIAPFISHEHPQTIALILSQLESEQAAGILAQLPEMTQAEVAYSIATMENITPIVLKHIEESLEANLRDILGGNQDVGCPNVVADILNLTGGNRREKRPRPPRLSGPLSRRIRPQPDVRIRGHPEAHRS